MSTRAQIQAALESGRLEHIEEWTAAEPQVVRHLVGFTYHPESALRRAAAQCIARASRHHPRLVQDIARRLVWAMNDESGTNATTAPAVIGAIADEQPELLRPLVPDLIRLAADSSLEAGLVAALRTIVQRCPGMVAQELKDALNARITQGECGHA